MEPCRTYNRLIHYTYMCSCVFVTGIYAIEMLNERKCWESPNTEHRTRIRHNTQLNTLDPHTTNTFHQSLLLLFNTHRFTGFYEKRNFIFYFLLFIYRMMRKHIRSVGYDEYQKNEEEEKKRISNLWWFVCTNTSLDKSLIFLNWFYYCYCYCKLWGMNWCPGDINHWSKN